MILFFKRGQHSYPLRIQAALKDYEQITEEKRHPHVVTQIPVYNEYNVVEKCIRAAAEMKYPAKKHTIQILDDSTDETSGLIDEVVAELSKKGKEVYVLRRNNRIGFKAGALEQGMEALPADFYAIFDADFIPPTDFLSRTIPILVARPGVGLVQARWGHLNTHQHFITRAQGVGIDGHFTIEQSARASNKLFMNFNGTAGILRHQAIVEAGGWSHDTLTEDMDLSYRMQLAGWTPWFVQDLVVPAEIPEDISAFKSQQFRWAKGSIETAIKLLPVIHKSSIPRVQKVQAFFHLTHYLIHPIMLWLALITFPVLIFTNLASNHWFRIFMLVFVLLGTLAPSTLYIVSQKALYPKSFRQTLWMIPLLSFLGVGISLSNSRAVFEALSGKKSSFIRTPKRGDSSKVDYGIRMPWLGLFEILLGIYCSFSFYKYVQMDRAWAIPFILIYSIGFTGVGILTLKEAFPGWFQFRKGKEVARPVT